VLVQHTHIMGRMLVRTSSSTVAVVDASLWLAKMSSRARSLKNQQHPGRN
jgi:hypothetical protein